MHQTIQLVFSFMAARPKTKTYTFISPDAVSLHSIFSSASLDRFAGCVIIRANKNNSGNVFWQDVGGSAGGFLDSGEAATMDFSNQFVDITGLYLVGSANDVVYITLIS